MEIVFQSNAKGQTRFPLIRLYGNVTSYGDPAGGLEMLPILENEKFFELKSRGYRDGIKRKETR